MKKRRIIGIVTIAALMVVSMSVLAVNADVINYAYGVTPVMSQTSYWEDKGQGDADALLMTLDQVADMNKRTMDNKAKTCMYDLENMTVNYNADSLSAALANEVQVINSAGLSANGSLIADRDAYFGVMKSAVASTGYTGSNVEIKYAVAVNTTQLKSYPTADYIGYGTTDSDDEICLAALNVNEPFVIKQRCSYGGNTFYWGYTNNCTGWVLGDDLAICSSKEQWLDAWKVDIKGKDFVVVTDDKFSLEASFYDPAASEIKLGLGSVLKLVAEADKPETIVERNTWNNYVVYLPTRDADGNYVKKMALIAENNKVNVGYLPMTQKNILNIAFTCLGNRYGWGGMLDAMDCSLYIRTIYKCFGAEMPRNTTWQQEIPGCKVDVSEMGDEEKEKLLETMPIGTALYINGHTMLYIGHVDGVSYCISAIGSLVESTGDKTVLTVNNVVINPMTVRRGAGYNYTTWLTNTTALVVPAGTATMDISKCDARVSGNVADASFAVELNYYGTKLYENINYTVSAAEKDGDLIISLKGINNCSGTRSISLKDATACKKHTVVVEPGKAATCTEEGLSEGSHCSNCNAVIKSQQVIPATGHDYTGWRTVAYASCETNGKQVRYCRNCNKWEEVILYSPGHNWSSETSIEKAATDYYPGIVSTRCLTCGEIKQGSLKLSTEELSDNDQKEELKIYERAVVASRAVTYIQTDMRELATIFKLAFAQYSFN